MKNYIGKINSLEISKITDHGYYLKAGEKEVLLPNKYCTLDMQIGDFVEVFIYTDSMDRPVATTEKPLIYLNEIKPLKIKEIVRIGAFLDWGLEKDLFLPRNYFTDWISKDIPLFIVLLLDNVSQRPVADARIWKYLKLADENIKVDDTFEAVVYGETDFGFKLILGNEYDAMIYKNGGIDQQISIGDKVNVSVSHIREDLKINVLLKKWGKEYHTNSKNIILEKLEENDGFLPINDSSRPDEIREMFGLSKKKFKQFLGNLYKSKIINIDDDGISLKRKSK